MENCFLYDIATGHVLCAGKNLTQNLKNKTIDAASSIVSTNQQVRTALLKIQRACGQRFDLVAEGRDVGSIVFPDAALKFFLTASVPIRAQRWRADQEKKGNQFSLDEATNIISERDKRDSERSVAPLVKPEGAALIDNSKLNLQATVEHMIDFLRKKRA